MMLAMRTTVTLDPDVAAELKELARQRGVSFKEVLNDAVRAGLAAGTEARAYRLPTARLGLRPGVSLDGALRLAAAMEDEETVRKLELRK
jgi:predicted transcriptional regulator